MNKRNESYRTTGRRSEIGDWVLERIKHTPDGQVGYTAGELSKLAVSVWGPSDRSHNVPARLSELERDGLIERNGDSRLFPPTNRLQAIYVIVDGEPKPVKKQKRSKEFIRGSIHALKLAAEHMRDWGEIQASMLERWAEKLEEKIEQ